MLKNQLHASAEQVAQFRFVSAIPVFVAFIFGMVRDRWNPFGLRDRGFFLFFAPATGAVFIWLAFGKLQLSTLTLGVILAMITFRFVAAGYQGLMSLVGQEKLMSGRLSTIWNVALAIPALLAAYSSGWVTEHLSSRQILLLMAGLCFAVGIFGLWKQRAVFASTYEQPKAQHLSLWKDVKRLVGHRAIYGAILINFFWNFAPGAATPLQYYLTNQLHLPDSSFSNYNAIFAASFIPTYILYGFLCKKVPQIKLLVWGTVIGVPQMIPLLFVHSATAAQLMAIPIGLMGGLASAAYFDLAMRSCPPGLQGTLMMFVDGLLVLSARGGDILGTKIYDSDKTNGFLYCVGATTFVYLLILPMILLVPRELVSTRDGEANPVVDQEDLEELGRV
jgi:Na+/melibiose symporter-like transporter